MPTPAPEVVEHMNVPGREPVRLAVTVRLLARHRHDGRQVSAVAPAGPRGEVQLPGGVGDVHVSVACTAEPDGVVALRLACRGRLDADWVLYEAALCFATPRAGWGIVLPSGWGRQADPVPPLLDFEGNYPGWSALAQLMILQGPAGGLSVAVRDAALELKYLRAKTAGRDVVLQVVRVPELRGEDWVVEGDCDVLLAGHGGGWEHAAAAYRRQQERVRPELATPRPRHPLLEADPVWLLQNAFCFPPHDVQATVAAAAALDAPTIVHLYNWQDAPFDTRYPEWLGFRPEAAAQIRTLAAAGIPCVPYTNARQWDTTLPSFEPVGRALVCRDPAGNLTQEIYGTSNVWLGVVCPSQATFHEKLIEVCRRLATPVSDPEKVSDTPTEQGRNSGPRAAWVSDTFSGSDSFSPATPGKADGGADVAFPGLYLDQLGAAFGLRCYAADHGHAPGGARSWNAGQRELVAAIRRMLAAEFGRPIFLTTENASEPLVDQIDGFLYYCGVRDDLLGRPVPLWQAIYGDFATQFGDYWNDSFDAGAPTPPPPFLARLARQAIFGNTLGWLSPQCLSGAYAPAAQLIRNSRAARLPILDAIRRGTLCTDALDTTAEHAGVFLSAWQHDARTVALAVNPSAEPVEFPWPDGRRDRLAAFDAKSLHIE